MGEGGCVNQELDSVKHDQNLANRALNADDGIVEASPDEDTSDDLVGDFDDDVGEHECLPGVGLAGAFADLVEGALCDEVRLDLLDKDGEDGDDHEDTEDNVLHTGHSTIGLPEGETNEETRSDTKEELGEDVVGHAPVLLENTTGNFHELGAEGHGELRVGTSIFAASDLLMLLLEVNSLDLGLNTVAFVARLPDAVPIFAPGVGSVIDNLEHVLSGVLLVTASASAVALEIVEKGAGVVADITKVDSLTAAGEEEQAVELLEEDGAGLMDGAEDGLTGIGQLAEESANGPGALRVETTSRLIKEEKKLRLSCQFDTDSKKLALFNIQALAGNTDDGIGKVAHVEHVNNLLDESELLLLGNSLGLAEHGAEAQALADGSGSQVKIWPKLAD